MSKAISKTLGWLLLVIGLIGFSAPDFAGMELNGAHSIVLITTGLVSLYFGYAGSVAVRKSWCIVAGLVYTVISLMGLFSGPGIETLETTMYTTHLFKLIPGVLEFGTGDSAWQLLFGIVYLSGGFLPSSQEYISVSPKASNKQMAAGPR